MAMPTVEPSRINSDPIAFWHAEHVSFTRLLGILQAELASFHEGGQPDYALMQDVLRYLRYFPDRHHHPREDVAFRLIAERLPHMQGVVNRLLQEHRVIESLGEELLHRLEGASEGLMVSRQSIEAFAATYLVYYHHHLATEESEILPRAAQILTPEDWRKVAEASAPGVDPLFGAAPDERYRELRRRIVQEAALRC